MLMTVKIRSNVNSLSEEICPSGIVSITGSNPCLSASGRKLTITLELKPDDERQTITVSCTAKSTLAPTNPVVTSLYVADEENVVEMVPQIPGQFGFDGVEQEAPPSLKIIKFA